MLNNPHISYLKKLVSQGQFTLYSSIVEKLSYLILFAIFARIGSPSEYGLIITTFTFSNILVALFNLGLGINLQRESAINSKKLFKLIENAIFIRMILFFVFSLLSYIYILFVLTSDVYLMLIPIAVYLSSFCEIFNRLFWGIGKFKRTFIPLIFARIFIISILLLYLLLEINLEIVLSIYLIGVTTHLLLLVYYFLKEFHYKIKIKLHKALLKRILIDSIPLGLGTFAVILYDKIDIIVIQSFIGTEAVAFYAVAYSIYKLPSNLPGILLNPLYSDVSHSFELQKFVDKTKVKYLVGLLLSVVAICSVFIYFSSDLLLQIIYGPKFVESSKYIFFLLLALPWLFMNNLTGTLLNSVKLQKYQAFGTVIGLFSNLIILLILIPIYGIWGAVIATIFAEIIVFLVQMIFLKIKISFK